MSRDQTEGKGNARIDIKKADANYKPFPTFAEWSRSYVDDKKWKRYAVPTQERKSLVSEEHLKRAQEIVKRAAAIDTGAIEGLYEVDRGFTFTAAMEIALWEATLDKKGPEVRSLIETQLSAYDYVLDFSTRKQPIAEAWIRSLHEVMCRSQDEYVVYTELGRQVQKMPKGVYKHLPNHVMKKDGAIHSYAPVDETPIEMNRLCDELRSASFAEAHPVLQASYAHYALVAIHPFADGNGRVARALGSVYTFRALSTPLLILFDHREEYYAALEQADKDNYQPFVNFILARTIDAIQLIEESLRAAEVPQIDEALSQLKQLYVTKGGFTQDQVDSAAGVLHLGFRKQLEEAISQLQTPNQVSASILLVVGNRHQLLGIKYREPFIGLGTNSLRILFSTFPPAPAEWSITFGIEVPKDCEIEDEIVIVNLNNKEETLFAPISELIPEVSASLQLRLRIFVQRIFGEALTRLSQLAENNKRDRAF